VLPKGTIIHVVAWHDNTKGNRFNRLDQWRLATDTGLRSTMAHAWMNATHISDEDTRRSSSSEEADQHRCPALRNRESVAAIQGGTAERSRPADVRNADPRNHCPTSLDACRAPA
jgi:hypothetical protein